jgi:MFS family permease
MENIASVVAIPRRRLTAIDYKTLCLATLGGLLELYDFIIFVFFANTIGQLFFPLDIPDWLRQFQTFGIFAAGYLARPLGGVVMAHVGDLRGRKQMFTLSVFLMALPTLGIGLLPTYGQVGIWAPVLLLLFRILQGVAVGGEVPGAWVFVSEHVSPSRVGLACGILTGGLSGGILLGSLVATSLTVVTAHAFRSNYKWKSGIFRTIGTALAKRNDLQLVLSVGDRVDPQQMVSAPKNVIIVQRAPQLELLKLVSVCITHAELNTVLGSLREVYVKSPFP